MAQIGNIDTVSSVNGPHFIGALAQNASRQEDLTLPPSIGGSRVSRARVRQISVWSTQNLDWELGFYGKHDAKSADPNLDTFKGRWQFVAADGVQDDGAGLYRYHINGLDFLYVDDDRTGILHLVLVNRSAAGKTTYGAGSHFRVEVGLEPSLGW